MKILVTGGTGFIGSHTCVELLNAGFEVVIVDNLFNSKESVVKIIEDLTNKQVPFYKCDCTDMKAMEMIFKSHIFHGAIHFAGYKAVGESVEKPLMYYENNLQSTLVLCELMKKHNVKNLVFSSSATVYGTPKSVPIKEDFPLGPTMSPYGTTKLMIEQIMRDVYTSDHEWNMAILRYFNPIGAHESGLLGESPNDVPNNLMPYIVKVANKELPIVHVFGDDYDTIDGTGVRDYIHVVDLAKGHVNAIRKLINEKVGVQAYNLGTGVGCSVINLIKTFARVNEIEIPYQIDPRRLGDIAEYYADTNKAYQELGWKAEKSIDDMCLDSWRYIKSQK